MAKAKIVIRKKARNAARQAPSLPARRRKTHHGEKGGGKGFGLGAEVFRYPR
jgi:hypothetical protein